MNASTSTIEEELTNLLATIPDPEIPVISIVDLGILRKVEVINSETVEVTITPTYSGCPAMRVIEEDIKSKLKEKGYTKVQLVTSLSPAWTTDWMSDDAKERLRIYGISPPEKTTVDKNSLTGKSKLISCPQCGSSETEMISQFGSTACKALYRCISCREPFDHFKCI